MQRRAEDAATDTTIAAGTTVTQSGIMAGNVTLEAGATLSVASQTELSVFGAIAGPDAATGSVALADQAILFAAGAVGPGVVLDLSSNDTLELAAQSLGAFSATIAGLHAGNLLDIASAAITAASLGSDASGGTDLTLLDDGAAVATLRLAEATGPALLAAVPDGVDGTLILAGPAMAQPNPTAAPGTQGGSFQWQGAGGLWGDAANWSGGTVPGALDTVRVAGPSDALLPVAGAAAAASLTTSGDVALAGNFVLGNLVVAGAQHDVLDILAGAALEATDATLDGGVWQVAGAGATVGVTATTTLASGSLDVVDGGVLSSGAVALAGATLRVDASGGVAVGGGAATPGTATIASGGTLSGFGTLRGAILDGGLLLAQGGTLSSFGEIGGAGQVLIGDGATLFAAAGIAASASVSFAPAPGSPGAKGSGTLELFAPAPDFAPTLLGTRLRRRYRNAGGLDASWPGRRRHRRARLGSCRQH